MIDERFVKRLLSISPKNMILSVKQQYNVFVLIRMYNVHKLNWKKYVATKI